jgi:membrane-bound serine protease (ClpP class)
MAMWRLLGALALVFALWSLTTPSAAAAPMVRVPVIMAQAGGADVTVLTGTRAAPPSEFPLVDAVGAILSDPNVAFLLLIVGAVGLVAEAYHPGAFVPGIVGIVAFLLGIVALGNLPTNWGAAGLLLFSLLLFLLELHLPSHGVLGAGGVVTFLLGGLLLFSSPATLPAGEPAAAVAVAVNPWLLLGTGAACTGFFLLALRLVLRARHLPVTDPLMRLVGAFGVTASALAPSGTVRVLNESWSAVSVGAPIDAGEKVEVVAREGLTLRVRRTSPLLVRGRAVLPSQGEVRPGVRVMRGERAG